MFEESMQELFSLEGKTALVTGGCRGIGRMMAEGLLRAGAMVWVACRDGEAEDMQGGSNVAVCSWRGFYFRGGDPC